MDRLPVRESPSSAMCQVADRLNRACVRLIEPQSVDQTGRFGKLPIMPMQRLFWPFSCSSGGLCAAFYILLAPDHCAYLWHWQQMGRSMTRILMRGGQHLSHSSRLPARATRLI